MINIEEKNRCSGCHACASVCPKTCIAMVEDEEGFLYPKIDELLCIHCGLCENSCPIICPTPIEKSESDILTYAAYTKDNVLRMQSSSGGIFSEIASYVIENGGVVFGAAFDEAFGVRHIAVDSVADLEMLRGSKYVQSTIGEAYQKAEKLLNKGRLVLFTGTPCQIGGLCGYLKKNYDNLITQDIICHGAPSPMVWKKYITFSEKINKTKLDTVSFRDKSFGWKAYCVKLAFFNQGEKKYRITDDLFMRAFLSDLCLRPSCYHCHFKGDNRMSDFTLGDFWGIEKVLPEMDDDKGTSLVMVNSIKAAKIWKKIQGKLIFKCVNVNDALQFNIAAENSCAEPKHRMAFMQQVQIKPYPKVINKFSPKITLFRRVVRKVVKIIKR